MTTIGLFISLIFLAVMGLLAVRNQWVYRTRTGWIHLGEDVPMDSAIDKWTYDQMVFKFWRWDEKWFRENSP